MTVAAAFMVALLVGLLMLGGDRGGKVEPPRPSPYRGSLPVAQAPVPQSVEPVKTPAQPQIARSTPISLAPSSWTSAEFAGAEIRGDKAEVFLVLIGTPAGRPSGKLKVTLWSAAGEIISGYERDIDQKEDWAVRRFSFEGRSLERARLHVSLGNDAWEEELSALRIQKHEVRVLMSDRVAPASQVAGRVIVSAIAPSTAIPVEDAQVSIELNGRSLFEGRTDARGVAEPKLSIPDLNEGDYTLKVHARSAFPSTSSIPLRIVKSNKVLLITDKPLYQPGQEVLIRALALDELNLKPASGSELLFEIEDGRGNKVFKRRAKTSEFGIAHSKFELAGEAGLGEYKLTATLGKVKTEKSFTVKRYVLPRFEIKTEVEKKYYLPKETVKGTLNVRYFFGKPVAGGEIEIKASTFDVEFKEFASIKPGKTDKEGKASFEVPLPDYFVGQPLEKGDAFVKLDISIKDAAEHVEKITRTYPVASQPLRLTLVPESGRIVPDVENVVYLLATYPDGTPAATEFTLRAGRIETSGKTDEASGFTAVRITPTLADFGLGEWRQARGICTFAGVWYANQQYQMRVLKCDVKARDSRGARAELSTNLSSDPTRDTMLLRLDKAIYSAGDRIHIDVLSSGGGSAYIDVIKNRQTVVTMTVDLKGGRGTLDWAIPAELFGTLEVHAYQLLSATGEMMRDTRVVYAQPASNLKIKIEPDQDVYRPRNTDGKTPEGKDALIRFFVTDSDGAPVKGALGVIVVDSAVYALQEMQPGLEKVYFTLEQELQNPKYILKDSPYQIPELIKERERLEGKKQQVAQALLAPVEPMAEYRIADSEQARSLQQWAQIVGQIQQGFHYYFQSYAPHQDVTLLEIDPRTNRIVYKKEALETIAQTYWGNRNYFTQLRDKQGRSMTLAQILRHVPEYAPERAAAYIEGIRLRQLWHHLAAKLVGDPNAFVLEEGAWKFGKGALDQLGAPELWLKDALGRKLTLEELVRADDSFSAANFARHVSNVRRQSLLQALARYASRRDSLEGILDGGLYRDNALVLLVGAGFLPGAHALDPAGRPFNLRELAKTDPAFGLDNLLVIAANNQWWKIYAAIANYGWRHPEIADRQTGLWKLPSDLLSRLVHEGLLTGADLVDPWGRKVEFALDPSVASIGHIDYRLAGFKLSVAGQDGKIGTPDDVTHLTARLYDDFLETDEEFQRAKGESMDSLSSRPFKKRQGGGGGGWRQDAQSASAPARLGESKREEAKGHGGPEGSGGGEAKILFVREWFPETLLFVPELITDDEGRATLPLKIADSITTWRLTSSAVSKDGMLGSAEADIRVFQDFFIEPDLPVALTQNDEISLPIAVYNYLPASQKIRLVFEPVGEPWFELLDDREKIVELKKNEVRAVSFRLKARKIGEAQTLLVSAYGTKMSDAVKKSVRVEPDGKMFEEVKNDRLGRDTSMTLRVPKNAIEGSYKVICKCYPGIFAQVLEGVEGILGAPHG
jgi:hypothetical protein